MEFETVRSPSHYPSTVDEGQWSQTDSWFSRDCHLACSDGHCPQEKVNEKISTDKYNLNSFSSMKPLMSSYAIPPGMSKADVGRLTLLRLVLILDKIDF